MPIFEYNCPKCGARFEELVFGSNLPECPECGNKETKKLLSCATLHMPTPVKVGHTVTRHSGGCGGCSGGNCSSCGS